MSVSKILSVDGDTIYVDSSGRRYRTLSEALDNEGWVSDYKSPRKNEVSNEEMEWVKIVRAAKNNPGLTDLLNRAKEFYILGHDNGHE